MVACAACGTDNPAGARFCNECGAALRGRGDTRQLRKTITVVFCDIVGSTSRGESMDIEPLRGMVKQYFDEMKAIIERHGGTVESFIGDAVMGAFGVRRAREDDALRGLRAAAEMRAVLPRLDMQARIGVNTGEVMVAAGDDVAVIGDAVNVAARLQTAAGPGEIVAGATTIALAQGAVTVEALPPLDLKGKSQPVDAFRVLSVSDPPARAHETRFVGRAAELEALQGAWGRLVRDGTAELFTVVGEPGVGKSRLVAELIDTVDAQVVRGRCVSYGEGITYWPVVDVIKEIDVLPSDAHAADQLRALLGQSDSATSSGEIAWAFRKLLEQESPLLVVFDDCHWAESTFLDLVEQLPAYWAGAGLLVVCLARPELEERRPRWNTTVRLKPLSDTYVHELLPSGIPKALREGIVRRAGGNPLFVTEMLAMAAQTEGEVVVPPTLKALLAARLDQLASPERTVLEGGSIEGELFHRGGVEALTAERAELAPALAALVRNELVRPAAPQIRSEEAFQFCHLLIRDAAYAALPKAERALLHERFADWLTIRASDLVERDELIGFHLEQAHRYHVELGSSGPALGALAARAASHLAEAALRAARRSDFAASASLLERALAFDAHGRRERLELELELGRAFGATRRIAEAERVLSDVAERATAIGEAAIASVARVLTMWNRTGEAQLELDEVMTVAKEAIRTLTAAGDDAGLVPACRLLGLALGNSGDAAAAEAELERALVHAAASGDKELQRSVINTYANGILVTGPTPAPAAVVRCNEFLLRAEDDRVLTATVKRPLSIFCAMVGRGAEALVLLDEAAAVLDELALRNMQVYRMNVAYARELAGDLVGAERELVAMWTYFNEIRLIDNRGAQAAVELAHLYCDQRRWDEAADVLLRTPDVTYHFNPKQMVSRQAVEARVLAWRGLLEEAVTLGKRVAAEAESFEGFPDRQARLYAAVGEVQHAAGNAAETAAATARAIELHEKKGNVVAAGRLRALVADRAELAGRHPEP